MRDVYPSAVKFNPEPEEDFRFVKASVCAAHATDYADWLHCLASSSPGSLFDSPIEEKLAEALYYAFEDLIKSDRRLIESQVEVGPYRADFRVRVQPHAKARCIGIVVECDGQEFHTSDSQRKLDKQRDGWMKANGFAVIRFSGSRIYNDAKSCAGEVRRLFNTQDIRQQ